MQDFNVTNRKALLDTTKKKQRNYMHIKKQSKLVNIFNLHYGFFKNIFKSSLK